MAFIIRVRAPAGVKRLMFKDENATWGSLQLQVQDVFGVPVVNQLLSSTPLNQPSYVEAKAKATLASLKFKHGHMFYLSGNATKQPVASRPSSAAPVVKVAKLFRPSEKCQHGPRGRCLECVPIEEESQPMELNTGRKTNVCNHGPGVSCLNCSRHVGDTKAEVAEWLCNHATTTFCPKCLPPEEEGEKPAKLSCSCDASKGQSCLRCHDTGPVIKVDKIPYRQYMRERRAVCQYKHAASMSCGFCMDPQMPSYVGKKSCSRGHRPWPHGVCTSCAPPNANLRVQNYRHCDNISLQPRLIINFYKEWMLKNRNKQRAAILFGTYMDEPDEHKNAGAVRAVVQALYEPPQEALPTGPRFLVDPNEKHVHQVAASLGLEPVGWVITTQKREGKQYGGAVFLSGSEMRQAARFQWRYKNGLSHSRFVTVVIEHGDNVEPKAYQVSDQCVALERDGVFAPPTKDVYMMGTRKAEKGQLMPKVVLRDKMVNPGEEFMPDEFLVKVITSSPKDDEAFLLAHASFPSAGPAAVVLAALREHMRKFEKEEYTRKLSDLNLLCFLQATLPGATQKLCHAIRDRTELDNETKGALDMEFIRLGLFS